MNTARAHRLVTRNCGGLLLLITLITPRLYGGPVDSAIVAAMKLPQAPNYSWVTEVIDDARGYRITGATERHQEFSRVTLPVVAALRRQLSLGGGNSDNEVTAIYRGDQHLVIEVAGVWKTIDELGTPADNPRPATSIAMARGGRNGRSGSAKDSVAPVHYSNLQLTLSRPHDEIAIIIANAADLKAEDQGISGDISDVGARLLLVHPGQNELTPLRADGSFRLWIQNGFLIRYSLRLSGEIAVQAKAGRRTILVHQNATTSLHHVGATTFSIPDEARRKLRGSTGDPLLRPP